MVDKFFADIHLNDPSPKVGQSQPVKIIADNGRKYFLKTEIVNNVHQNAVFFQELLCSLLAKEVGVPIPNFAIIEIEEDFIENNPNLRFGSKFKQGLYFATEEIMNTEDNLADNLQMAYINGLPKIKRAWNGYFRNVDNKEDYAKIIAFDCWIQNFDRFTNIGNLLVGSDENSKRLVYAIDHGHAFGSSFYDQNKKNLLSSNLDSNYCVKLVQGFLYHGKLNLGPIFQGLEQNIDLTEVNPFAEVVSDIEGISLTRIQTLLEEIPNEWLVGGDIQKNDYLNFVNRQKMLVRNIITIMVEGNSFSNYVGGDLEWIEATRVIQEGSLGTQ